MGKVAFRTARRHVDGYRDEVDLWLHNHREAMKCRDCEDFVRMAIDAHEWVVRADMEYRQELYNKPELYDAEYEQDHVDLCRQLIRSAQKIQPTINALEAKFDIEKLDEYRKIMREVSSMVRAVDDARDESQRRATGNSALTNLCDSAINDFRNSQTSEFI